MCVARGTGGGLEDEKDGEEVVMPHSWVGVKRNTVCHMCIVPIRNHQILYLSYITVLLRWMVRCALWRYLHYDGVMLGSANDIGRSILY